MRDGYYISSFLAIGELQAALDIKLRHDQTVALWKKQGDSVALTAYWELERFSGWKQHTYTFQNTEQVHAVLRALLKTVGLSLEDIVEIWGTPQIDTGRDYDSSDCWPDLAYHSICHLFAAMLFDSRAAMEEDMLVLALDSGPDNLVQLDGYHKKYYAGAYVSGGKITVFPIQSPGKIWSNSKKRFGMREGSLMALASASSAACPMDFDEEPDLSDEGALDHALAYLDRLEKHIQRWGFSEDDRFGWEENHISAFMKQVDRTSRKILTSQVDAAIAKFGIDCGKTVLGLAGGFCLNCPTNTYLMDRYGFKRMVVPPCTNDCGEALGIGLYAFYKKMGKIPRIAIGHAFYGNPFRELSAECAKAMEPFIEKIERASPETIADDLQKDIVVWIQGRAEMGPRALGHRSILGNPMSRAVKDRLNRVKGRQWWRPVAPIVLEEYSGRIFVQGRRSPFMLEAFQVKEEWKEKAPAVLHLDGTARVQTLARGDNELLYDAIQAFYQKTGVPMICNTSLNDKGEPIIQDLGDALAFALKKNIRVVYADGLRIQLKEGQDVREQTESRDPLLFSHPSRQEAEQINRQQNPHGLNKDILTFYFDNPEYYLRYDLKNPDDCREITAAAEEFMKKYLISLRRDIL